MKNLPPLPPSDNEFWDGEKNKTELKEDTHKCEFVKVSPTEIKCKICSKGYTGNNIDTLLKLLNNK